jgi:hypothetical protein
MQIGKVHCRRQKAKGKRENQLRRTAFAFCLLPFTFFRVPSPLNRDDDHSDVALRYGLGGCEMQLPRKEVIQPHLPVRLPCYDFVPVAPPALGRCPPSELRLAHGLQALATPMT